MRMLSPYSRKRMLIHPKHSLLFKKEIDTYHKVGFIKPIDYLPWLANIFLAIKLLDKLNFVHIL